MKSPVAGNAITDSPLTVGEFRVLAESNELDGPAGLVRLRPLLMQVLLRLAQEPGAPVTREQLINDVWARKIVNDEVLSRAIAELRLALGDDSREPRYIETLPKVGYRLVAAVSNAVSEPKPANAGPSTPAAPDVSMRPVAPVSRRRPWSRWLAPVGAGLLVIALVALWVAQRPGETAPDTDLTTQLNTATPLASDPALELAPRFSPDGRQVIYVRRTAEQSEIVIQAVASGERRVVVHSAGILASPMFAGGDRRIAYWRQTEGGCAIVARDLAGGTEKELLDCTLRPQTRFDLSADATRLVFTARPRADYPSRLVLLHLADGRRDTLTEPKPGDGADSAPRFSPDGTRIAFFRGSESHDRVWIVQAAPPHAAKPASEMEGLSYGMAWAGNQGPLLVAADWHGFRALNELDLQTGQTRLLGARGARFPDRAAGGDLVFEHAAYRADLWLTDADAPGKQQRMLWPSTRYTNQAEFSPDGKRVVFASNRDGAEGIFVGDLDGDANAQRISLPAGFRYIRPHWSADGRQVFAVRIAVSASRPTQQQAIRIDVATGAHEVLTSLGGAINAVYPLDNGDLLVGEIVDYAMRLVRVDAGGTSRRLALPLVNEFAVRGNALVYTLPQLVGATHCMLDTMRCTPLKVALSDSNRFDWALASEAIWFRDRDAAGRPRLVKHDLRTGQVASFDFAPSGAGSSIAISPDGKRLIVMREAPPAIDLMLARRPAD